jgi:hypothetical protein
VTDDVTGVKHLAVKRQVSTPVGLAAALRVGDRDGGVVRGDGRYRDADA